MDKSQERLQKLFEKISDAYDGTVEQKHVTDEYVDVQFLRESTDGLVEVGHVRLSFVEADCPAVRKTLDLVSVVDHYGGEEIFVSEVVSAIVAVATK